MAVRCTVRRADGACVTATVSDIQLGGLIRVIDETAPLDYRMHTMPDAVSSFTFTVDGEAPVRAEVVEYAVYVKQVGPDNTLWLMSCASWEYDRFGCWLDNRKPRPVIVEMDEDTHEWVCLEA